MALAFRQDAPGSRFDFAHLFPAVLDRNRLFAGLVIIGFANGIVARIADGLRSRSLVDAVMNTFDISAIIWIALVVGVVLLLRSPRLPVTKIDQLVAAGAAAAFLVPVAPLSWMALSGLAIYTCLTTPKGSFARRGGWILLAMTVPMLWSRAAFSLFSESILEFDAVLVGWTVGAERLGNTIAFLDGSGYLWIAPACSSITNVSLAVLCWILFTQLFYRERSPREIGWCVLACAAVVAINVTRLSLIAFNHKNYDIVHGTVGTTVANWLSLAAIVSICALGVRNDLSARR
jgi:exosortase/archaeosortase family protein